MFHVSMTSSLAAFIAFVLSATMVNHGLVDSSLPTGPGLTLDESFNIDQGVYLVDAIEQHGPLIFTPLVAKAVFGGKRYLPDHPPLGRVLLGVFHQLTSWAIPGSEGSAYNVPAARLGSCFAFAMTVLLLCEFARRRYDENVGICAAVMLIGMPHLMGHARIAALESSTNLAWVATMLPLLAWWTDSKPPSSQQALISGGLWGLLLLTKVQGIFVPPIVFLWAVWRFRAKAILPMGIWGLTGAAVFFAWPWLWQDPLSNIQAYLGRTTERIELYCWYFGQRYADKSAPWHFPVMMVLISLPAWTIVGLGLRVAKRSLDSVEQLLVIFAIFPLVVFSIPAFDIPFSDRSFKGVPVYDGTRLFLIAFPSIAMLAARGISLWLFGPVGNGSEQSSTVNRRPSSLFARRALVVFAGLGVFVLDDATADDFSIRTADLWKSRSGCNGDGVVLLVRRTQRRFLAASAREFNGLCGSGEPSISTERYRIPRSCRATAKNQTATLSVRSPGAEGAAAVDSSTGRPASLPANCSSRCNGCG